MAYNEILEFIASGTTPQGVAAFTASAELRRVAIERAAGRCEYCRIRETDTFLGCQIDHVIPEKHIG